MSGRLLEWYRSNARSLPWRSEPRDPFQVVVSEFMLQQTQVDRVIPKYQAFLASFPTFEALAAADDESVLEAWSGLGYYRRARLLHRLARQVVDDGAGLPRTAAELEKLPGVGPYTAAAVASLAFGEQVPVVDGNVMRVASRVQCMTDDPRTAGGKRAVANWVREFIAEGDPAGINEALMELGATVCLPDSPSCCSCPLSGDCLAHIQGRPESYPVPRRRRPTEHLRWVAACCVDGHGRWMLQEVSEGPILRGLWLPPLAELFDGQCPIDTAQELVPWLIVEATSQLPVVKHTITHRSIKVFPVRLVVSSDSGEPESRRWVDPDQPGLPTSSLLKKLAEAHNLTQTGGVE